jgi:uncharacterized hydantoinase/oxoprolinase family protein
MLCADLETSTAEERHRLAEEVYRRQTAKINEAIHTVGNRWSATPRTALIAGEGGFLAAAALNMERWAFDCREVELQEILGADASRAACAYAVAVLAAEHPEAA